MVERKSSHQEGKTEFSPIRSIKIVQKTGIKELSIGEITSQNVGLKAFGLACIPSIWVPDFFVITSENLKHYLNNWDKFKLILSKIGFLDQSLYIRSSAVNESIDFRGTYHSFETNIDNLCETVIQLLEYVQSINIKIYWVIQKLVKTKTKGHLSNERRIGKDLRDFVLETELQSGQLSRTKAVRPWRDGTLEEFSLLSCKSPLAIDKHIKPVMLWTHKKKLRLHFEWVWDGENIWVVQADLCNKEKGEIPENLLKYSRANNVESYQDLNIFRQAIDKDYHSFNKLNNAKIYKNDLGFDIGDFYIIDNVYEIKNIINGKPSKEVLEDIKKLLKLGPLVIRTDVLNQEQHMLARSDELRDIESVISWFQNTLKNDYIEIVDNIEKYIFICHNFIPAIASAWSFAEPNKRSVRIEALWGIPEGMYWFSHDVYEVDTQSLNLETSERQLNKYKVSSRIRYKDRFIAPNEEGRWITYKTDERCDWKDTLGDLSICNGIALNSRKLSNILNEPVNIMWFIKAHKNNQVVDYMPWYHHKFELDKTKITKVSKFKQPDQHVVTINTLSDWEALKLNEKLLDRIIILPREEQMIRNDSFIDELANFVKEKNIVIELHGGILSHAFYMLQKRGCKVEVNDLFGKKEDSLVFKKIVRDKIPENIEFKGEAVVKKEVRGELLTRALKTKLIEEAFEVSDATSTTEIMEELADVLEVIDAIKANLEISDAEINEIKNLKKQEKGGFDKGIILLKTSSAGSLTVNLDFHETNADLFDGEPTFLATADELKNEINIHQDEKKALGETTKILQIDFPIDFGNDTEKTTFLNLPIPEGNMTVPIKAQWNLSRNAGNIRVKIELRPQKVQAEQLGFDW